MRALLLVATLSACAAPAEETRAIRDPRPVRVAYETPVFVDARFPVARRDAVEHALARWNAALGGARVFVVANDDLDRPRAWLGLSEHPLGWGVTVTYNAAAPDGVPALYLAEVVAGNDVQFYGDHIGTRYAYEQIALHELGHVLGLADNESGSRLMRRPLDEAATCIDAGTIAALVQRRPAWAADLQPECSP